MHVCMCTCIFIHTVRDMQVLNAVDFRMPGLVGRYGGTLFPSGLRRAEYTGGLTVLCVYTVHVDGVRWSVLCPTSVYPAAALAPACTTPRHICI
jgi:hypothetical protein